MHLNHDVIPADITRRVHMLVCPRMTSPESLKVKSGYGISKDIVMCCYVLAPTINVIHTQGEIQRSYQLHCVIALDTTLVYRLYNSLVIYHQ